MPIILDGKPFPLQYLVKEKELEFIHFHWLMALGCYLEFYGNTVYPYSGTLHIAGGFVFLAANNFQLDFSGGRTAGSVDQFGESVYYLNLGASFRIPR